VAAGGSAGGSADVPGAGPDEPAGRDVLPDPAATRRYAALSAVHRRIYPALQDVFGDLLAAVREGPTER
jgi:hypothetical protein